MEAFVLVVAIVVVASLARFALRRQPARQLGVTASPSPPQEPSSPSPGLLEPRLTRLYELHRRVMEAPRLSTADDLTRLAPFTDLVDYIATGEFDVESLLGYAAGDDALLAWAALCALARLPRDEALESRLMTRLNLFHYWTRHFTLKVLESWNPEDTSLAGRVLVRLEPSWAGGEAIAVLEQFLRRRAAIGAITLDSFRPSQAGTLREILKQVDPAIAQPLLDVLGPDEEDDEERPSHGPPSAPGDPGNPTLRGLGRVLDPGEAKDDGVISYPSADERLERILAALTAEPSRPVLVVGEAGVGKSSLIRRAEARLSQEGWRVFEAGAPQINAGMSYVGMLEARVQRLQTQLRRSQPRTVWVIPDFHQMLWTGRATGNPIGVLELLIPAIEAGGLHILGEVRPAAFERVQVERPEVGRLFEVVRLEPPADSEVAHVLEVWNHTTAEHQRVDVSPQLRMEALSLARQYLAAETPPGGVLRLINRAVAGLGRPPNDERRSLSLDHLVDALVHLTGLPAELLDERRTLDLDVVRRSFESRVIGQTDAVGALVDRLALMKAGVTDPNRPYGVFLFAGGTGTGKTELAKALAQYLFGSTDRLVRMDMSELMDVRGVERVIGGGPDTGQGGNSLVERVRRQPFCVVLLDEFEKAHVRVWDLFLQVFDDGRLTDHRGETASFRQAIIILTSNLGARDAGEVRLGLVGAGEAFSPAGVERAVERTFRPELLNRLDRIVVFRPLTREIMRQILRKELADVSGRRGLRLRQWAVEVEESAMELLIERGFSPTLGARPLRRALERFVLTPLARAIVDRSAPAGDQFLFIRAEGEEIVVEFVDPDAPTPLIAGIPAASAPGDLTAIVYEPRGNHGEVECMRRALETIKTRVSDHGWQEVKQRLMLEPAAPGFWERPDRFETLGRAEYLDRIESSLRTACSLFERLTGEHRGPRPAYAREMVRRLAQQLYLLETASQEALTTGPRDAFVSVEAEGDADIALDLARRLALMYERWARARGMRWADVSAATPAGVSRLHAIAGFGAYALLAPDDGLHVLEQEDRGHVTRRASVRVRVIPQPFTPVRDGAAGLRRQALEGLAARPPALQVVRRYREGPTPLVRDAVRGWRTGRLDRVLAGDFDVIPVAQG